MHRKIEIVKTGRTIFIRHIGSNIEANGMDLEDAIHELVGKLLDAGILSAYDYGEFSYYCKSNRDLDFFEIHLADEFDPYGSN